MARDREGACAGNGRGQPFKKSPNSNVIVLPRSYTSSICTGYSVAESVYFAPRDYLSFAENEFQNIKDSHEPMMFPLPKVSAAFSRIFVHQ